MMPSVRIGCRRRIAWLLIAVLTVVPVAGCVHRAPRVPTTVTLPPGRVPDESLLPVVTSFPPAADPSIAQLDQQAHQDGTPGMTALVDLLHAGGVAVRSNSASAVVFQASAAPQQGSIGADLVTAIHTGLVSGESLSLNGLAEAIGQTLGTTVTAAGLAQALHSDLTAADRTPGTGHAWAEIIYDSGPLGATLRTGGVPGADATLDSLQSILLLQQMIGTAAAEAGTNAAGQSPAHPAAESSSCNPSDEAAKKTFEDLKSVWGLKMGSVLDYVLEEAKYTAAQKLAVVLDTLSPIVDLVMLKVWFHGDITRTTVTRTQSAKEDGDQATVTGHFYFRVPAGSYLACLALWAFLMTAGTVDVHTPDSTDVPDMPVQWRLEDNSDNSLGGNFVEFPKDADPLHTTTGKNDGKASITVTGTRQLVDKSQVTDSFTRHAAILADVDPSGASDIGKTIITAFVGAVQVGMKANGNPISLLVKAGIALLNEIGFFHFRQDLPVKDWGGRLPVEMYVHAVTHTSDSSMDVHYNAVQDGTCQNDPPCGYSVIQATGTLTDCGGEQLEAPPWDQGPGGGQSITTPGPNRYQIEFSFYAHASDTHCGYLALIPEVGQTVSAPFSLGATNMQVTLTDAQYGMTGTLDVSFRY